MISRDFIMMMIGIIGFILTLAVTMLSCKIEELQKEMSFIQEDIVKLKRFTNSTAVIKPTPEQYEAIKNAYQFGKTHLAAWYGTTVGGDTVITQEDLNVSK